MEKSGKAVWSSPGIHDGGLLAMDVHPGGELVATAGQDGRVLLWSAKDGRLNEFATLEKSWVENVAWSSNGKWLAASNARRVHVFSIEGEEVWQSEDHPSTVSAIAWSNSEELATACYGRVSFFEAATGALRQKLGVERFFGVHGPESGRETSSHAESGQLGPLAPVHCQRLHDVGLSRKAFCFGF